MSGKVLVEESKRVAKTEAHRVALEIFAITVAEHVHIIVALALVIVILTVRLVTFAR